ncbi:MAG TPA: prephenate dehydratase domain-containing protein [Gemmatimonadaceae bacterium]|nr:prephenate dehydratase domain-containing protein [Gemmatimonadaceae bacterium]
MTAARMTAPPRVAYQGEPGAYGEQAVAREWGGAATAIGAPTFRDALSLLGSHAADFAMIPVWNSTIGEIQDTKLLLAHHAARVEQVSELTLPVVHCLLGLPGATLASLRYVGSHPAALAQCRGLFANRRTLQPCVAHDTAGAARELAALGTPALEPAPVAPPTWFAPYRPVEPTALAAIAGQGVARLYGLAVIAEAVQDNPTNATRFVIVRAQDGARW